MVPILSTGLILVDVAIAIRFVCFFQKAVGSKRSHAGHASCDAVMLWKCGSVRRPLFNIRLLKIKEI